MNFFRRKKQKSVKETYKNQNEFLISELHTILKTHGDAILRGKTKLTLTAPILTTLNGYFHNITEGVNEACFQVMKLDEENGRVQLIPFIFDFVQKVIALKLTSGAVTLDCPSLHLEYFKALQVLEIRRIEISLVKGLFLIRRQLKKLTCYHSTQSIHGIVVAFGRNGEDFQQLSSLDTLEISYNQVDSLDDEAFKCFPVLTSLDASYNSIECADSQTMPPLKYLNLACNMVHSMPVFSHYVAQSLTTLVLRNNNLNSLHGVQNLNSLVYLDVASNCILEFIDLQPLAKLDKLCKVIMSGNPVCYKPEYRFRVIRSLSPMKRHSKIMVDGIQLNSSELCHLGEDVQPVPLTDYLGDGPLGKREASLISSARNSLRGSFEDIRNSIKSSPARKSTPNLLHRKESKKVRNAVITEESFTVAGLPDLSSYSAGMKKSDSLSNVYHGSHRNSIANSTTSSIGKYSDSHQNTERRLTYDSWIEEESRRSVEYSNASDNLSDEFDSTSELESVSCNDQEDFYGAAPMSIAKVVEQLNSEHIDQTLISVRSDEYVNHESDGHTDGDDDDGISIVSDNEETEYAYLVGSMNKRSKDEEFSSADVEYIFIVFKLPYLIEKSADDGKVKFRLDLDYLQNFDYKTTEENLRIVLRFDLVRTDCQYREYEFEDKTQFDSVVDVLRPIYVKNRQKKLAEMKHCECLKCGLVFYNRQNSCNDEGVVCADVNCQSRMVIEKTSHEINVIDQPSVAKTDDIEENGDKVDGHCSGSCDNLNGNDSSIAIVIPSHKNSTNDSTISSWPTRCQQSAESHTDNNAKSFPDREIFTPQLEQTNNERMNLISELPDDSHRKDDTNQLNIYTRSSTHQQSRSLSASSQSLDSSSHHTHSCGQTTQTSKGSTKTSRASRSNIFTSVITANNSLFTNLDDPTKCGHRLMLYFDMKVFADQDEKFICQNVCYAVGYERANIFHTMLIMSNRCLYVFTIIDAQRDDPEESIKLNASCGLDDLRFVSIGYFAQSLMFESKKSRFRFKFLVNDSTKTTEFINLLEDCFLNKVVFKSEMPVIARLPNPQTMTDIRTQVFHVAEEIQDMGRRLYEQILQYTSPPLLKLKKMRLRTHQQCFLAKEFLDWLCARKEVPSRAEGIKTAQQLLDVGAIYHVSKDSKFRDDDGIYKFSQSSSSMSTSSITNSYDSMENKEDEENNVDTVVQLYTIVQCRLNEAGSKLNFSTIVLTNSHIFLLDECHQWPLSRLHPPPSQLSQHYTKEDSNKITDITTLEFYDDAPCYFTITFVKEVSSFETDEKKWLVKCETTEELGKLIDGVRHIWEDMFAVELSVTTQPTIVPVLDSYVWV